MQLLGKKYSYKIDKLYKELQRRSGLNIVVKNIGEHPNPLQSQALGSHFYFKERIEIYLTENAYEVTVAHELMHGILHTEGYVSTGSRKDDLEGQPNISVLSSRITDTIIHQILYERLKRLGLSINEYDEERGREFLNGNYNINEEPKNIFKRSEADILILFQKSLEYVEASYRYLSKAKEITVLFE